MSSYSFPDVDYKFLESSSDHQSSDFSILPELDPFNHILVPQRYPCYLLIIHQDLLLSPLLPPLCLPLLPSLPLLHSLPHFLLLHCRLRLHPPPHSPHLRHFLLPRNLLPCLMTNSAPST